MALRVTIDRQFMMNRFSRKTFLFFLVFALQITLLSQSQLDSLKNLLSESESPLALLNDLAELTWEDDPEFADSLARLAFETAKSENSILEQARAAASLSNIAFTRYDYQGVVEFGEIASDLYLQLDDAMQAAYYANDVALAAYEMDLYDVSLRNYKKTIRLLIDSDAMEFLPTILINMAQVYMREAMYDSAILYNEQAIALLQHPGAERELSAGYGNLGFVYKSMGNYTRAFDKYQKALELSKIVDDPDMIAVDLNNIASIYSHWENYEMADDYFRQAIEIHKATGALDKAETAMNNLAFVLQKQGDYQGAMLLFRESLAIALSLQRTGSVAVKMANIGSLHFEMGNLDSAVYYQKEALKLSRELGRRFSECSSLQSLAAIYVETNQPEQASYYLQQALSCATEIRANSLLEKVFLKKSELYEKQGNHSGALEAYRRHIAYRDSVFTQENKARLDQLQAVYQSEKQQHEIELLMKDKALNEARIKRNLIMNYWLGSGLTILLIASAIVTWLLIQKSKANRKLVEKSLQLIKNEECVEMNKSAKAQSVYSEMEKDRLIRELNQIIREEKIFAHQQLSMPELASKLNTNTTYLSKIINDDYGVTFPDFINQLRIKEAQKMFTAGKHESMTIEAVADTVGFRSRSAFNNAFKKFLGVTPSVFIKNVKKFSGAEKSAQTTSNSNTVS